MFHLEAATPIAGTFANPGGAATTVNLSGAFHNEEIAGTIVRLATTSGNIDLEMFDSQAPANVANYLNYVNSGRYNGTIIHRSIPTFVIQGGGFTPNGQHIEQFAPVRNEFSATRSNVRGTIAMAKIPGFQDFNGNGVQDAGEPSIPGGGPNSATSEFFINLNNNAGTAPNGLDFQNGGFTVFGQVINNGMTTTVDPIAALPITDASEISGALTDLPTRTAVTGTPTPDDMVLVNTASVVPEAAIYTYSASSDNPGLVTPTVNGTDLTLAYGTGTGTANITVTATAADGSTASQTFQAGVGELTLTLSAERGQRNSVTFTDADGTRGAIAINRAGLVNVRITGTDLTQTNRQRNIVLGGMVSGLDTIAATDTTQDTTITVRGRGGDNLVSATGLTTQGPIRTLATKGLDVAGNVTIGGTARLVQLGRLFNGTLTIGGTPADAVPVSIDIARGEDASITSGSDVRAFKAGEFSASGGNGEITAPSLLALSAKGPFAEDVTVSGPVGSLKFASGYQGDISVGSVRTITVRGDMTNANVDTSAAFDANPRVRSLGSLKVSGAMNNVRVRSSGNVGSITGGSTTGSTYFAAIQGSPNQLPTDAGRFNDPATIATMRFGTFADTLVSASALGRLNVGTVTVANGGNAFGVAANTITLLSGRTDGGQRFTLRNVDTQADADQQIAASGATLTDFAVRLF
jgi:peptidyl-prolyl cis-trans isomerase A (cyclophilin A)